MRARARAVIAKKCSIKMGTARGNSARIIHVVFPSPVVFDGRTHFCRLRCRYCRTIVLPGPFQRVYQGGFPLSSGESLIPNRLYFPFPFLPYQSVDRTMNGDGLSRRPKFRHCESGSSLLQCLHTRALLHRAFGEVLAKSRLRELLIRLSQIKSVDI